MLLKSINPATGEVIREYDEWQWSEIDAAMDEAVASFHQWRKVPISRRKDLLEALANKVIEQIEGLALNITLEMGKPIKEAKAELEKCAWLCRYYAEHAETFLEQVHVPTEAASSYISFQPLGPVLAIMPWNFPFWQVFRFSIPAILAGNSVLLKHASNVPACAIAIDRLFSDAGFPYKVFQTLLISRRKVERLIADRRIQAVTFTGSTPAGRLVGEQAGRGLKKTVMELGGSDPYIILADADLEKAADACVQARILNAGQSCISAKRFVVEEPIYNQFLDMIAERMKKIVMGDPTDEKTDLGPLARNNLRLDLEMQVNNSIEKGAELILGGNAEDYPNAFYPPTILSNVKPGMPAYHDELFGPVAVLIKAANTEEAICIANDTTFGLGAAVFTSDVEKGRYIAEFELDAGCCFVNDFVRSDPRLPFGGVKESGHGRELSVYGLREFVNIKTVVVR
ncbi:NAD-dependent succinate-semialdehyde dehydrogenase [Natronoflexus pectinivorans]|uniref:Succinate-semialdehyde dehydrogenase/glutarate-semialdehyde dehydrogenase n=1 Tax=Natronoflexus pectinivorans TaxID=682526 RepID=A0A4R2GPY0_9BACT|nr:NAD-dependent succinate-semialdehyde dehydrogenase [Natronoflexus pectinivorans]TCO10759.1 succinate-semialdehyde dehydrogenase/glutarate-semialdehyde dehydrogenase [Natronoflexus pectinivorans]